MPFGPRASNESPPVPVRAEDFWGEESASIHDAMAGPRPEVDPTEPIEPLAEPPPHRRARARRTLAPRVRVRRPPLRISRPHVRLTWPRVRGRPVVVAAGVASSCLVAASIVGSLWSGRVPLAHGGRDGATLGPAVIAPAVPPITTAQTEGRAESRRRAATHGRASRRLTRVRVRRARECLRRLEVVLRLSPSGPRPRRRRRSGARRAAISRLGQGGCRQRRPLRRPRRRRARAAAVGAVVVTPQARSARARHSAPDISDDRTPPNLQQLCNFSRAVGGNPPACAL